uniref:Integrin-linked protein kinase (Trinotate prediction) n=1 Tax=Henneguya salminicola TaxID=69463 RepID=A0A6G3MEC7_HENSL
MEDISLVDISYKNFLEEIWNARLNALDRKVIVRKIFPERNKKLITSIFIQEYHSLDISNVKSILPPAGFLYSTLQLWVIQPYSELAGTLYSFLRNKSINIPEEISLNLAINVCQGVQYIHKNPNLLNRYIPTTHNILVNDNLEAKLNLGQCPFSFQSKDKIINPQYFSPEALTFRMGGYDKFSSDMWSFGIVLYELFARSLPYDDKNSMHTGYNIAIARLYPQLKLSNAQIDKIMNLCLNPVPSKRPQLHQITPILIKMKELLNEK